MTAINGSLPALKVAVAQGVIVGYAAIRRYMGVMWVFCSFRGSSLAFSGQKRVRGDSMHDDLGTALRLLDSGRDGIDRL